MEFLRTFFPFAFTEKKDITGLIVSIIIHIVSAAVIGFIISIFSHLPLIGYIISGLGGLIDLYIFISLVLSILDYLNVLK